MPTQNLIRNREIKIIIHTYKEQKKWTPPMDTVILIHFVHWEHKILRIIFLQKEFFEFEKKVFS